MGIQQMLFAGAAGAAPSVPVSFVKSEAVASQATSHALSGIQADDLVIVAGVSNATTPAVPTSFNLGANGGTSPGYMWSWFRSSSTSLTISGLSSATGTSAVYYIVLVFRNVSPWMPFSSVGSATGTGTTITPPAGTTLVADQMVVLLGMLDDDNVAESSLAAPSGYTLTASKDAGTDGNDVLGATVMGAYKARPTAGAETPGAFTFNTGNDQWIGFTLILVPNTATEAPTTTTGQQLFTSSTTWTVPSGVTQVSAVCIGGGGGGAGSRGDRGEGNTGGAGGALTYSSFKVLPGQELIISVGNAGSGGGTDSDGSSGGSSSITRAGEVLMTAQGGSGGVSRSTSSTNGGSQTHNTKYLLNWGGGNGGSGGGASDNNSGGGGGGAGGYSSIGGSGGNNGAGSASAGGGGGGGGATNSGQGYSGGGVGVLGAGANGGGGALNANGLGGSGGGNGSQTSGGQYGGGGGARDDDSSGSGVSGGAGAVRIIYGSGRLYPSTNTGNV